jgi:hypothetical protein
VNKKLIYILLFSGFALTINAQNFNVSNERTFSALYNRYIDTSINLHSSIKPIYKKEASGYDSVLTALNSNTESKFIKTLSNYNPNRAYENTAEIAIMPILTTGFTLEKSKTASQNLTEISAGLNLKAHFKKKWSGQFIYLMDFSKYPSHIDAMIKSKNISPGYGYSKNDRATYAEGNITFTADDNFTFQLGYGKNFIGDGYRSLFLSDNANSYPYLKVTANIWKLKYMSLYTNYFDINGSNGNVNNYFLKFSSTHYLSYNATNWLNIGFFESIIWQSQEDQFYRGYDINYLNPVIFLRPIEYAQGSSDNALLGGSLKVRIKKKTILYSQVLLDEFLLEELKAGNGWWANKYGIQVGIKSYDFLWVKNLTLQLEYNVVRPFTYSYFHKPTNISTLQNYAHFNSPLAHPLGANFNEIVAGLTYTKKRWIFEGMATVAKIGLDTSATTSIGQDVYLPYNFRAQNYGYETGGGLSTDILNSTLKISYVVNAESQMLLQIGVTNRMYKNKYTNESNNMIFIGFKTAITNRYTDF